MKLFLLIVMFAISTPVAAQENLWIEKRKKRTPRASSVVKLAKRVSPAVVNVLVSYGDGLADLLDTTSESSAAQGTGFIIHPDGLLLTNAHVVENAARIRVRLLDKSEHDAVVVGIDTGTDLALLKIETNKPVKPIRFPTVVLGDSDSVQVGEGVVAIGNPLGLSHSVTSGIVSALGRRNLGPSDGREMYTDFIQTDASINPGNSGGPLINLAGEVIGINTAINRHGQGIGFAIPINIVKVLVPQLHSRGYVIRSWIGLRVQKLTPELAKSFGLERTTGALVTEVIAKGPAKKAGFEVGDVILKFRGKEVISSEALPWLVATSTIKRPVDVELSRGGKTIELKIQMEELPDQSAPSIPKSSEQIRPKSTGLGISVETVIGKENRGVWVKAIDGNSPASKSGLRLRDVVVSVMDATVDSDKQFHQLMEQYAVGDIVRLKVNRSGRVLFVAFER